MAEPVEGVVRGDPANAREEVASRGLGSLLFGVAVVAEIATYILMTLYRYQGQGLAPVFADFTKSANQIGLLFILPFLIAIGVMALRRERGRISAATTAAVLSATGLMLLTAAPMITAMMHWLPYSGWVAFLSLKTVALGVYATSMSDRGRTGWRRFGSVVSITIATVLVSILAVIIAVLVSPFGSSIIAEPRQEFDAGVILGAAVWSGDRPSPVLRERIKRGYDLLRDGTVQFLVVTGGHAPNELAEAEVARRELVKLGADPTRIVLESNTNSTIEQILYIRDQIQPKQGWHSFVIISDQFHLKRALEICRFNGVNAVGVSSESPLGVQNLVFYHLRESAALVLYWLFGI